MRNSTFLSTVIIIIVLSQCFQANAWRRRRRRRRSPVIKPPSPKFVPAPRNPSGIPLCKGEIDVNQILQRGASGRKKRSVKRQTKPWPFDCSYASIVNYQKSFQFMTPIYSCCDKCKHPTYTQCLATRASPYWVCPAAGLHCLVDCVTKHDPNRKKSTTRFRSRFTRTRSRVIRKRPQKVKKLKCTEIVTVSGKKCTKQLCVSLIQPTNG